MIDIKIKNIDQLMQAYGNVGNIVRKEMKDALNKSAAVVENAAKRKTPVNKTPGIVGGHLRRSIHKTSKARAGDSQVAVGSNVKYALIQHESLHFRHATGEAKFLDKALKQNESRINRFFKEMINNVIKRLAKYR